MPTYGFKLMSELHGPRELVRQAHLAERAGFGFAGISDHIHPWLSSHDHSPFVWSVLGAIAERTERIELITMVTCPTVRYHPVLIAQAAATIAVMSDGRFTLGVGSGEGLNEHVVGRGWPAVDVRHSMLGEAIEAIRQLWTGGFCNYGGRFVTVEDARIYDLPEQPPQIAMAVSGPKSVALAGRLADGLVGTDADAALLDGFAKGGGDRHASWTEVPMSWHPDEGEARRVAHERLRFSVSGWDVMAELPQPESFDAASEAVTEDDVAAVVPCGSDPETFAAAVQEYVDAGYEHIAVLPVGDDIEGFLRFWTDDVRPLLP
jgi:G6PDH family F420-dependent oxidoreductase